MYVGRGERRLTADAVAIATPWPVAARLLATEPHLARQLADVRYASMAIITMVIRGMRANGSGLLAPPAELPSIKAMTYSSTKWWLAATRRPPPGDLGPRSYAPAWDGWVRNTSCRSMIARCSPDVRRSAQHARLAAGGAADGPRTALGWRPSAVSGRPSRAGSSGEEQVAAIPRLALCGAALDGIGVAACIGSGTEAATKIIADLGGSKLNHLSLEETA